MTPGDKLSVVMLMFGTLHFFRGSVGDGLSEKMRIVHMCIGVAAIAVGFLAHF